SSDLARADRVERQRTERPPRQTQSERLRLRSLGHGERTARLSGRRLLGTIRRAHAVLADGVRRDDRTVFEGHIVSGADDSHGGNLGVLADLAVPESSERELALEGVLASLQGVDEGARADRFALPDLRAILQARARLRVPGDAEGLLRGSSSANDEERVGVVGGRTRCTATLLVLGLRRDFVDPCEPGPWG